MTTRVHLREDGSLWVTRGLCLPSHELVIRASTPGGPGGQHANRSHTKIVVTWHIATSQVLQHDRKILLTEFFGPSLRVQSSSQRSQRQNKEVALVRLGERVAEALTPPATRRSTRPSKSSREKRLQDKKARAKTKSQRRIANDD